MNTQNTQNVIIAICPNGYIAKYIEHLDGTKTLIDDAIIDVRNEDDEDNEEIEENKENDEDFIDFDNIEDYVINNDKYKGELVDYMDIDDDGDKIEREEEEDVLIYYDYDGRKNKLVDYDDGRFSEYNKLAHRAALRDEYVIIEPDNSISYYNYDVNNGFTSAVEFTNFYYYYPPTVSKRRT